MSKEPDFSIDPVEAVAIGATIRAARFSNDVDFIAPQDVIPHNLGIEEIGGITHTIIDRNTTIPIKRSKLFTTDVDNATEIKIHVIQVNVPRRLAVFRLGLSYCQGSVALQEKYLKLKLYWILMQMGYLTLQLKIWTP